jgi:hypothetical protein
MSERKVVEMRKVFLEELPRWSKGGEAKENTINWKESIGYMVKGICEGVEFEVTIVDYQPKEQFLYLKYEDQPIFKISTGNFKKCKVGNLLGKYTNNFKINIGTIFKDSKRDITIINRENRVDKNNKNLKYYQYTCNKCSWTEGWITEYSLLRGCGCSCCGTNPKQLLKE